MSGSAKQRPRPAWEFKWPPEDLSSDQGSIATAAATPQSPASTAAGQVLPPPRTVATASRKTPPTAPAGQVVQLDSHRPPSRLPSARQAVQAQPAVSSTSSPPKAFETDTSTSTSTRRPAASPKPRITRAWEFRMPDELVHVEVQASLLQPQSPPQTPASPDAASPRGPSPAAAARRLSRQASLQKVRALYANPPGGATQQVLAFSPDSSDQPDPDASRSVAPSPAAAAAEAAAGVLLAPAVLPLHEDIQGPVSSAAAARATMPGAGVQDPERKRHASQIAKLEGQVAELSRRLREAEASLRKETGARSRFQASAEEQAVRLKSAEAAQNAVQARLQELTARLEEANAARALAERSAFENAAREGEERKLRETAERSLRAATERLEAAERRASESAGGPGFLQSAAPGEFETAPLDVRTVFQRFGQGGIAPQDGTGEEAAGAIRKPARELISIGGLKPGSRERVIEVVRKERPVSAVPAALPRRQALGTAEMAPKGRLTLSSGGAGYRSNPEQILERAQTFEQRRRDDGSSMETGSLMQTSVGATDAEPARHGGEEQAEHNVRTQSRVVHDPLVREAVKAVMLTGQMQGKPDMAKRATDSLAALRRLLSALEMKAMGAMGDIGSAVFAPQPG